MKVDVGTLISGSRSKARLCSSPYQKDGPPLYVNADLQRWNRVNIEMNGSLIAIFPFLHCVHVFTDLHPHRQPPNWYFFLPTLYDPRSDLHPRSRRSSAPVVLGRRDAIRFDRRRTFGSTGCGESQPMKLSALLRFEFSIPFFFGSSNVDWIL